MAYVDIRGRAVVADPVLGFYDKVTNTYKDVLKQLLPPGAAWDLKPDGVFENLLHGLGYSFERVVIRAVDLGREITPATMSELLDDWERVLHLPGDNPSPPSDLAGRREAVEGKLLGYDDPSAVNFEAIGASRGFEILIVSMADGLYNPFVAGSAVGAPLWQTEAGWPFHWWLLSEGTLTTEMQTLIWFLNSLAPLHTTSGYTVLTPWPFEDVFETWTGDDPDNWDVTETGSPAPEVTEVGSGEGYGGTGTGSVNFYSKDSNASCYIDRTTNPLTLTIGEYYIVVVDVSYAAGPGNLMITDTVDFHEDIELASIVAPERIVVMFEASATSKNLRIGLQSAGGDAYGQVTIDRVRVIGPLDI